MKKNLNLALLFFVTVLFMQACNTVRGGAHGRNASHTSKTVNTSINELDYNISTEAITYTIDISTDEGRTKLKSLSLREAEELALREAIIKNGCAAIFNPQYTNLMKGKRVLRITVYGFPAVYKNK